jgi:hypothetical protein
MKRGIVEEARDIDLNTDFDVLDVNLPFIFFWHGGLFAT